MHCRKVFQLYGRVCEQSFTEENEFSTFKGKEVRCLAMEILQCVHT